VSAGLCRENFGSIEAFLRCVRIGCNAILNNQRIALITHSKRDAQWENPKPDINTVDAFDLDKFKQSYFAKMDFISHFE
jgi:hypothetical protein